MPVKKYTPARKSRGIFLCNNVQAKADSSCNDLIPSFTGQIGYHSCALRRVCSPQNLVFIVAPAAALRLGLVIMQAKQAGTGAAGGRRMIHAVRDLGTLVRIILAKNVDFFVRLVVVFS